MKTGIRMALVVLSMGFSLHAASTLNCGTPLGTKFNLAGGERYAAAT